MPVYLLRVALPDRPGALGAVASRIGAVRADVVAVDILGQDRGRAVDELIVELADERHVSLLLDEIAEVDGVAVEEVRVLPSGPVDHRFTAYETAAALLRRQDPAEVLDAVVERCALDLQAAWVAAVDLDERVVLAAVGEPPAAAWLAAYVAGSRWCGGPPATETEAGPGGRPGRQVAGAEAPAPDVAWVPLERWDLVLVCGRPGHPFTAADLRHLAGTALVADARWADLASRQAQLAHPSRGGWRVLEAQGELG
ncbi:hypothetical protein [Aciditerrimonas ferrireducens]|nr:hypothetical protein [Aciditerrimonas ferrireducens]MCK4177408.1 hypothetical protein [Aciditerrimonas ferrireducens]